MSDINLKQSRALVDAAIRESLQSVTTGASLVYRVRLDPLNELLALFGLSRPGRYHLAKLVQQMQDLDLAVGDRMAVFPSFDSARFFFPYDDDASHRFLIREILAPRSYSLTFPLRIVMRVYYRLVSLKRNARFMYRCVSLRVDRP
ncbi:MAG: hypothetical protein KDI88_19395 [Gammaproteobacteria bacterium]|nr:hypothetical protein [Gammaproteobacteria bacterium]